MCQTQVLEGHSPAGFSAYILLITWYKCVQSISSAKCKVRWQDCDPQGPEFDTCALHHCFQLLPSGRRTRYLWPGKTLTRNPLYVVLASKRASQELSFICVIVLNPLLKSTSRFLLQTAWFCLVIYLFVWQDKEICCSYWNPTQSRMWNDLWPFTGHIHSELGVTWWPIWGSTVLEQLLYYYYFVLSIRKGCQV